jgi:hypothetical protein
MNYLALVGLEPTKNNNKVIRIYTCCAPNPNWHLTNIHYD